MVAGLQPVASSICRPLTGLEFRLGLCFYNDAAPLALGKTCAEEARRTEIVVASATNNFPNPVRGEIVAAL